MGEPMFDMPEHLMIPVTAEGHGPVDEDEAAGWACWCGCPESYHPTPPANPVGAVALAIHAARRTTPGSRALAEVAVETMRGADTEHVRALAEHMRSLVRLLVSEGHATPYATRLVDQVIEQHEQNTER